MLPQSSKEAKMCAARWNGQKKKHKKKKAYIEKVHRLKIKKGTKKKASMFSTIEDVD